MAIFERPYAYAKRTIEEPDWRRFPRWRDVTREEWRSAQWQRANSVKSPRDLRAVVDGPSLDAFLNDLVADQASSATMSMLLPPHMLNTMAPQTPGSSAHFGEAMYSDPVRHYMLPVASDRRSDWPSHPEATRDSLHEQEMWAVEGLTHRYPTKVLAELVTTCPQYCGHCTRMDLVGNSTATVEKTRFSIRPTDRFQLMTDYLRRTPGVRDVVVSGGDIANLPWVRLESFVDEVLEIDSIRDVRLASKALMGLPQHWLRSDVLAGVDRLASKALERGVALSLHTHVNHVNSVTQVVAEASAALMAAGLRSIRNQGVLMSGVNATPADVLDLSFALLDSAMITPYYMYMCDIIPHSEHWRTSLATAQRVQEGVMGYLPGYATPRIVCDVPYVGKRWVHQVDYYDRATGVSYWKPAESGRPGMGLASGEAVKMGTYFDPLHTLGHEGQALWSSRRQA